MGQPGGYAALVATVTPTASAAYTRVTRDQNPPNDLVQLAQVFLNRYLNDPYQPPQGPSPGATILRWLGRIISSYEKSLNLSVTPNPDSRIWGRMHSDPLHEQGLLYLDSLLQLAYWGCKNANLDPALRPQFNAGMSDIDYFNQYLVSISNIPN
jgi:hypothetical protein